MTALLFVAAGTSVLLSATLTAGGTAVSALGPSRVRTLVEEGFRGAGRLREARAGSAQAAAGVSATGALLDCLAVALLVGGLLTRWGPQALPWAIPATVAGVLLLSGVLPRWIAARASVRLALALAPVLLLLLHLARPLLGLATRIGWTTAGHPHDGGEGTEARELREIAELGRREGVVEEEEHLLVERAFRMDELTAWDVMVPRVDIFAWKDSLTLDDIVLELRDVPLLPRPRLRGEHRRRHGNPACPRGLRGVRAGPGGDHPVESLARPLLCPEFPRAPSAPP